MESSTILGTILITVNYVSLVMPSNPKITNEIVVVQETNEGSGSVTHGQYFGENISRVIKTLKKN